MVGREEREAVVSPERAGAVLCARRLVFWGDERVVTVGVWRLAEAAVPRG